MKKSVLDYVNIFLVVLLLIGVLINLGVRIKNKEWQKLFWESEISSGSGNTSPEKQNVIKVLEVVLYNTIDGSTKSLNYDDERLTGGKINSIAKNSIPFGTYGEELLPDSLSLSYFSVDERQFYHISTKLNYDKIKSKIKDKGVAPLLSLEIQPKGVISLKIFQNKEKSTPPDLIETFKAKKTSGNVELLVYEKSLGEKYNRYKGIENIEDFSDLHGNRYFWSFKIEKEENDQLTSVYAYSFSGDRIEISEENDQPTRRNIPRDFYMYWKNGKKYDLHYYIDPAEILSATRKLTESGNSSPIIFTLKISKTENAQFEMAKDGIVIPLKNLYP